MTHPACPEPPASAHFVGVTKMVSRPTWPRHWMNAAYLAAEMSTCAGGRKVGAVAVIDNVLITSGVNGVPSGAPHPEVCQRRELGYQSGEMLHLCGCEHAETNLICNAAAVGVQLAGSTVYVTSQPCAGCIGRLRRAKVAQVVFCDPYPDPKASLAAGWAGIALHQFGG